MQIERRLFPRIKYPDDRKPELAIKLKEGEVKKYEVVDISERGIGLIGENLIELQARTKIEAKIIFSDGNELYVEGSLLRVGQNRASIYLSIEIPASRIKKERELLSEPVEERMKGEVISGKIDPNQTVISKHLNEAVQDLSSYFKGFCEQINWWLLLRDRLEKEQESGVDLLKPPICIELQEFTSQLLSAYKKINGQIYIINNNGLNSRPRKKLSYVRGKKEVKKWQDYLKEARNKYVAHRLTNGQGEPHALKEVSDAADLLEWDKLKEAFAALTELYRKFEKWHQDPQNKAYLALSDSST